LYQRLGPGRRHHKSTGLTLTHPDPTQIHRAIQLLQAGLAGGSESEDAAASKQPAAVAASTHPSEQQQPASQPRARAESMDPRGPPPGFQGAVCVDGFRAQNGMLDAGSHACMHAERG